VTNGVQHVDPTVAGNPSQRDVRSIQDRATGAVQTEIGNEPVVDTSLGGLDDIDPTVLDGPLDTDPIQSGTESTSIGSSELIRQLTLDKSTLIERQKSDPTLAKARD
jgi:hypothetical protein